MRNYFYRKVQIILFILTAGINSEILSDPEGEGLIDVIELGSDLKILEDQSRNLTIQEI